MKKVFIIFSTLLIIVLLCSCSCSHEWQEASCSAPQTCLKCGETLGSPLTHAWQEASCTTPKTCLLCGITEGDPLPHEWVTASCTEPKSCFSCGLCDGNPLGHTWMEATCSVPETCSVCGEENGNAPGHLLSETVTVAEASCSKPGLIEGICSVCQSSFTQETPLLEHTPSDWEITIEATYDEAGTTAILCTKCGAVIDKKPYELTEEEKEKWYKANCETIAYSDLARNPDAFADRRIKITGEIGWITDEADNEKEYSVYSVWTKKSYGIYFEDTFYVTIYNYGQPRILTGDVITFYGTSDGLMDEFGETFPRLSAVYYEIK